MVINYFGYKNKYPINNFNHFQLLLHANCNNFISVQAVLLYFVVILAVQI